MKYHVYLLLWALFIFACTPKDSNSLVSYTVSPHMQNGVPLLQVQLSCEAEPDGSTTLLFLDNTWGETDLHNTIENIRIPEGAYDMEIQKDSGWITITHPKDLKTLSLEYRIMQDTELPLTTDKTYRPVIQANYFHVFSHGLFMLPVAAAGTPDQKFDLRINWDNFPDDFTIQNSFGSNEREQWITNTTQRRFLESVYLGGDYRTYPIDIKGNTVVFSTRDNWSAFKDSTLVDLLKTTMMVQRDFWQDHTQPYFSVHLSPTVQENGSSFQGTGLSNSFDCHASNNTNLEVEGLVYLFNHELMHNWIGYLIKNEDEEAQYWFSEGFTEYYTIKNIAKHNIYNLGASYFAEQLNEFIRLLHSSPVKEAPNSEITYDNFWKDYNYEKLPYRRGALFAFYLDLHIQRDTAGKQSLDDLMRALKADALLGQELNHPYFIEKANTFLKEDLTPVFNAHIEDGQLIDLERLFTQFDLAYTDTALVYDRGFTYDTETKEITEVDTNSNAFKAGIRRGDILTDWHVYRDTLERNSEFTVRRGKQQLNFEFSPSKTIAMPQLVPSASNNKKLGLVTNSGTQTAL